jgi:hypothetical protein
MIRYLILTSIVIIFNFISTEAQTKKPDSIINKPFPKLVAETLAKKAIEFPKDVKGKPTIILIAFKREAQTFIDPWSAAILKKYPQDEVNYYEIPMISGGYKLFSRFIDGGMRGGVPLDLHDNVATYYGSLDNYIDYLKIKKNGNCYLFLLDKNGNIIHHAEGPMTDTKWIQLMGKISGN